MNAQIKDVISAKMLSAKRKAVGSDLQRRVRARRESSEELELSDSEGLHSEQAASDPEGSDDSGSDEDDGNDHDDGEEVLFLL